MHVLQEVIVVWALLCVMVIYSQQSGEGGDPTETTTPTYRRQRRNLGRGRNPYQEMVNALQTGMNANSALYMSYTPSTPSPQDINCYVEVPITVRRGGRCIRLSSRRGRRRNNNVLWGCQAGLHLDFSPECQPGYRGARG